MYFFVVVLLCCVASAYSFRANKSIALSSTRRTFFYLLCSFASLLFSFIRFYRQHKADRDASVSSMIIMMGYFMRFCRIFSFFFVLSFLRCPQTRTFARSGRNFYRAADEREILALHLVRCSRSSGTTAIEWTPRCKDSIYQHFSMQARLT